MGDEYGYFHIFLFLLVYNNEDKLLIPRFFEREMRERFFYESIFALKDGIFENVIFDGLQYDEKLCNFYFVFE